MKERINSYVAILLITIMGAVATTLIVHVASVDAETPIFLSTAGGGGENYINLQQSLLR